MCVPKTTSEEEKLLGRNNNEVFYETVEVHTHVSAYRVDV